jgi:mevalonate kinase
LKAIAEAPCKVIITGEHFVVHGGTALAAAVGRKVRVEVSEGRALSVASDRFVGAPPLDPIRAVLAEMKRRHGTESRLSVSIASEIPPGAGLGSSAATMVALASAVARFSGVELAVGGVVASAMAGERVLHGNPSGIDPNVCARGGVLTFTPGRDPSEVPLDGRRVFLVVQSGRRRSTRKLVSKVSEMKRRRPHLFAGLAAAATDVTSLAVERLRAGDMDALGRLMTYNHAVLSAAGASDSGLDGLVDLLISLGCPGAKLTGAGGGGSVLAVPPTGKEKSVLSGLSARGINAFRAELPVEGVHSWLS